MTQYVQASYEKFDITAAYSASVLLAGLAIATLVAMTDREAEGGTQWQSRRVASRSGSETSSRSTTSRSRCESGSLTALLGPSGSGKSTLLRVIAGLEAPDSGDVFISGKEATAVAPQQRGVGFVFQHYAPFKHMTVRENVAFALTIRAQAQGGDPRARRRAARAGAARRAGRPLSLAAVGRASGSGWRSRARWRRSPTCCCSTSRSARSTRACARSCARGCGACTRRPTRRRSSSPTIRRRRWRSRTGSC